MPRNRARATTTNRSPGFYIGDLVEHAHEPGNRGIVIEVLKTRHRGTSLRIPRIVSVHFFGCTMPVPGDSELSRMYVPGFSLGLTRMSTMNLICLSSTATVKNE